MRWLESKSRAHIRMVRYFLRLQKLPNSRLTKRLLNYDIKTSNFGSVDCWSTEICTILNDNGLGQHFDNPGYSKEIIRLLTDSLTNKDIYFFIQINIYLHQN